MKTIVQSGDEQGLLIILGGPPRIISNPCSSPLGQHIAYISSLNDHESLGL